MVVAPARLINLAEARARFGSRADLLGAKMSRGDPLADAALAALPSSSREQVLRAALDHGLASAKDAPPELAALFAQLDRVPPWLDRARADRGGAVFRASGPLGDLVLGVSSLVLAFASPAGNKPLFFSGQLRDNAERRLTETRRFVHAVSRRHGMSRSADGFKTTVRVRFVHAQVRAGLRKSSRWDFGAWGEPINQADMATSVLLFSLVVLDGLRRLGVRIARRDAEDVVHLWRYVGYVIGVDEDLLCATEAESRDLWDLFAMTQGPPDADSRVLAASLLEVPLTLAKTPAARAAARGAVRFGYAASRALLGDELADALGYPPSPLRHALPLARPAVRAAHAIARRLV